MEITNKQIAEAMLSAFDSILIDRMNETLRELITESLLDSFSPIVRIVNHDKTIAINSEDYSYNDLIRFIISELDEDSALIIDGNDILYWD